jgi:hypothetical protein
MATTAQINAVAATIVAQVPAHAAVPASVITDVVGRMLNALDSEVVVASTKVAQVAENNAVAAKSHH